MERLLVLLLSFIVFLSLFAATEAENLKNLYIFSDKNGLYGLLDENGKKIVPAKYTQIEVLGNDRIALFAKDGIKIADEKGQIIGRTFYEIGRFMPVDEANQNSEMLAAASLGPNKYGFIDKSGNFKIAPVFEGVHGFSNGFGPVKISGKWGLIDKNGKIAIKTIYDDVRIMQKNRLLLVTKKAKTSKKCVVKNDGTIILNCEYDEIQAFNKLFYAYKNDKSRIFDLDGKLLFESNGRGTLRDRNEGMTSFETKKETVIFDTVNKIILSLDSSFKIKGFFHKGRIEVETPEKHEKYFDITGKWFSFEEFLTSDSKGENFRILHKHGKSGLIDSKGIYILKPEYDWNELKEIEKNTFLIRKNGFFIFSPPSEPREIKDVDNVLYSGYEDLLFFEKSEKTGIMTSSGKIVVPAKYDEITGYNMFLDSEPSGVMFVRIGKLYGVIDKASKEIFPIEFDYIGNFYGSVAIASKNGKYMVLERSGKIRFVSEYPIEYLIKRVKPEFVPKKERWIY